MKERTNQTGQRMYTEDEVRKLVLTAYIVVEAYETVPIIQRHAVREDMGREKAEKYEDVVRRNLDTLSRYPPSLTEPLFRKYKVDVSELIRILGVSRDSEGDERRQITK